MSKNNFYLIAVVGFFLCAIFSAGIVSAQSLPEDAPVLISQNDSTRALAVGESRGQRPNLSKVFPAGNRTFITFFVTNLDLLPNEDKRAFRADIAGFKQKALPARNRCV